MIAAVNRVDSRFPVRLSGLGSFVDEDQELSALGISRDDEPNAAAGAVGYGTAAGLTWLDPNKTNTEKLILSAPQIAGATVSTAAALNAGWATAIIPVIGPIIAGVTIGLSMLMARKGPKQKVATTEIVDKVEPLLRQNVDAYLANPTPDGQRQAIENFNAGWQYVVEHCGIPEMGNPGRNCITERDRGGKWDWFALYADPIVNTPPRQQPSAISRASGVLDSILGSGGTNTGTPGSSPSGTSYLVPIAGLALLAFVFLGGDK
jgi:hypothetical protein